MELDAGPDPRVPDTYALRRRVLFTGVVSLVLFLAYGYLLASLEASQFWALPGMVLLYFLVIRPMMRPVRAAVQLRRRLAYQAYLDDKQGLDSKENDRG